MPPGIVAVNPKVASAVVIAASGWLVIAVSVPRSIRL